MSEKDKPNDEKIASEEPVIDTVKIDRIKAPLASKQVNTILETEETKRIKTVLKSDSIRSPLEFSDMLNLTIKGAKGFASMNGRTVILSGDSKIYDAEDVTNTISVLSDGLSEVMDKPMANRATQDMAKGANPEAGQVIPTTAVVEPALNALKKSGDIPEDFDFEKDISVETEPLNMKPVQDVLKVSRHLIFGGTSAVDTTIAAVSRLAESDSFKRASPQAKKHMVRAVANGVSLLDQSFSALSMVKAAEAMNGIDINAERGIAESTSKNGKIIYEQLGNEEQTKLILASNSNKANALQVRTKIAENDKLVFEQTKELDALSRSNVINPNNDVTREIEQKRAQLDVLKKNGAELNSMLNSYMGETERMERMAVRGVPHDRAALILNAQGNISANVSGLTPVIASGSANGKGFSAMAELPEEDQARAIATYAVNEWYADATKGKSDGMVAIYSGIRKKTLDEIAKGNIPYYMKDQVMGAIDAGKIAHADAIDKKNKKDQEKADYFIASFSESVPVVTKSGSNKPVRLDNEYDWDSYRDELKIEFRSNPQVLKGLLTEYDAKHSEWQEKRAGDNEALLKMMMDFSGDYVEANKEYKELTKKTLSQDEDAEAALFGNKKITSKSEERLQSNE